MNHSSPTEVTMLHRFVQAQRFRHRQTGRIYVYVIRQFQLFVSQYGAGEPPSVSILQHWLKDRRLRWPMHMVFHHARLVERFLDWLLSTGAIPSSPFAELHGFYGLRTAPIVRALLSEDAEAALQQLRPIPRFGSFLGKLMEEHVVQMRSLGYRYDVNEGMLLRFDRFLQNHPDLTGTSLNSLIEHWSNSELSPYHLCEVQKVGRILSKAIHRLDPDVPILPLSPNVVQRACLGQRKPHVYTDEEVQRLLQAALSFPSPMAPLRPLSLFTMLMLAYCAGLRVSEIARLTLADLNLPDETIDIRETKFFKSRRLPLAPRVMTALKQYLAMRQAAGAPVSPQSALFWNQRLGQGYTCGGTRLLLVEVLRRAGLKPESGAVGPRVHDLRHTMVGHRMRDWYKAGINPQAKLPYLATYLGHKDIRSTLVYLNITTELLQEASERFRQTGAQALRAAGDLT
jgi:integrase